MSLGTAIAFSIIHVQQVRTNSIRKRNTTHTPTSQVKHTHAHTNTPISSVMHQLVKNTRNTYIK